MGHSTELEKALESIFREKGMDYRLQFEGEHDFDLGLEIALLWVDKLCEHLSKPKERGGILQSVKTVFKNESLLLLHKSGEKIEIVFSDIPLAESLLNSLCRPGGVYSKLANIRFTRCFSSDTGELSALPSEHPPMHKVLAVPVFVDGVPSGCLAMMSDELEKQFSTTHAMVLSLAASILSLAKTYDELRDKVMLNKVD